MAVTSTGFSSVLDDVLVSMARDVVESAEAWDLLLAHEGDVRLEWEGGDLCFVLLPEEGK